MAYLKHFVHNMLSIKYKWQKRQGLISAEESRQANEDAAKSIIERRSGLFSSEEYLEAEVELFKIAQSDGGVSR